MPQSRGAESSPFVLRLTVPSEGELRMIATAMAARVAEYLGTPEPDAESVTLALDSCASRVTAGGGDTEVVFEFRQMDRELLIEARCGSRRSEARCPLPA